MAETLYIMQESTLTDIADAIREKLDSDERFRPGQMANKIMEIPTGGEDPSVCAWNKQFFLYFQIL